MSIIKAISKLVLFPKNFFLAHNKVSNKVFHKAYKAQFGRGAESYMFSWMENTGHVRDTVKLFSSDVTILSRATNLVFVVSFYKAWFVCKLHFPVLNQTHLVVIYWV